MPQSISSKTIEKAIIKGAKKVIAESGLNPSTRSGNKELSHWATSLAEQPFPSLESAQRFGEGLGQKIVACSQTAKKQHLDGGVIRQLRSQKDLPAIPDIAATPKPKSPKPTTAEVVSKAAFPAPQPDETPILVEEPTSTEVSVSESTDESVPEVVSIPVEQPESTEEAATVAAVEDEDVIPAKPEVAKVEIDPAPEVPTTAEEPKSVTETVAQETAIAADDEAATDDETADDEDEVAGDDEDEDEEDEDEEDEDEDDDEDDEDDVADEDDDEDEDEDEDDEA